jgi:hypothetical protein
MPLQLTQQQTQLPLLLLPTKWMMQLKLKLRPRKLLQKLLLLKSEISMEIQPKLIPLKDHPKELQLDTVFTNSPSKVETHTLPSKCTEPKSQSQMLNINQLSSKAVLLQQPQLQSLIPQKCNTELMLVKKVS